MDTKKKKEGEDKGSAVSKRDESANTLSVIDRFFDDSLRNPFGMITPDIFRRGDLGAPFPKVDIEETDDEIKVVANIPGINPDDVDVEVGDDYVSLSGTVEKEEKKEKKGRIYRYEREYGEFRREFSLPARVDRKGISAKCRNGVLTVTLPKSGEEKKERIKIDVE